MSTCDRVFTHEVIVSGERMKRFQSLREAQWFCEGKPDAEIVKLKVDKVEKKSAYEASCEKVGECLY